MSDGEVLGTALFSMLALAYAYHRVTSKKRLREAQNSADTQREELLKIIEEHKKETGKQSEDK